MMWVGHRLLAYRRAAYSLTLSTATTLCPRGTVPCRAVVPYGTTPC